MSGEGIRFDAEYSGTTACLALLHRAARWSRPTWATRARCSVRREPGGRLRGVPLTQDAKPDDAQVCGVHALLTLHGRRCARCAHSMRLLGYLAWVTPPAQIAYSRVLLALQVALQREVVQILGSIADTATTILRGSAWSSTHRSLQGCPGLATLFAEGSLIGPTSKSETNFLRRTCIGFSCRFLERPVRHVVTGWA